MAKAVTKPRVLFVDDAKDYRDQFCSLYKGEYEVIGAASAEQAKENMTPAPDVVLLDLRLSGDDGGQEESLGLLKHLREEFPHVPVIMITAFADLKAAVECMRLGAADFINKADDRQEIKARIQKALEVGRKSRRLEFLEQEVATNASKRQLVGKSKAIAALREPITVAARSDLTVLILGETGTGKELVARAIHAAGNRSKEPFIALELNRLTTTTIESELFGHEKGAFTDAHERHQGYIERANRGVLFLDEIGDLCDEGQIQAKLLRFLQERRIVRVGGRQEIPVDVQIIAATNRDLQKAVREGTFRPDLYYRLKGYQISVPALRERRDDVQMLAQHFLNIYDGPANCVTGFSPEVLKYLAEYDWPGNVRELENTIKAAIAIAGNRKHPQIVMEDLPLLEEPSAPRFPRSPLAPNDIPGRSGSAMSEPLQETLDQAVARYELTMIQHALDACHWQKAKAWQTLGLHDRFALRRRVLRHFERFPILKDEQSGFSRLAQAFLAEDQNK